MKYFIDRQMFFFGFLDFLLAKDFSSLNL